MEYQSPFLHVGDIGTRIELTIYDNSTGSPLDISAATTKSIVLKKGTSASMTVTGSYVNFVSNGKDGKIYYVFKTGDLNVPGTWSAQAFIAIASASVAWNSSQATFEVMKNIPSLVKP